MLNTEGYNEDEEVEKLLKEIKRPDRWRNMLTFINKVAEIRRGGKWHRVNTLKIWIAKKKGDSYLEEKYKEDLIEKEKSYIRYATWLIKGGKEEYKWRQFKAYEKNKIKNLEEEEEEEQTEDRWWMNIEKRKRSEYM